MGIAKSVSSHARKASGFAREASGFARERALFSRGKRSRHYRELHKFRQGFACEMPFKRHEIVKCVIFARDTIVSCENECA